jgi:hypothetical protein
VRGCDGRKTRAIVIGGGGKQMTKTKGTVKINDAVVLKDVDVEYRSYVDGHEPKWSGSFVSPKRGIISVGAVGELMLESGKRATIRVESSYNYWDRTFRYGFKVTDSLEWD